MSVRRWRAFALLWGFAEATVFFIVPDVLLTLVVVRSGWRRALACIPWALAGALAGGAAMYGLAAHDIAVARASVASVPLISEEMIAVAGRELRGDPLLSMIAGSLSGTPYKVYAVEASASETGLLAFLAFSVVARPLRWSLSIGFAAAVCALLDRTGLGRLATMLWVAAWIAFYVFYYVIMSL